MPVRSLIAARRTAVLLTLGVLAAGCRESTPQLTAPDLTETPPQTSFDGLRQELRLRQERGEMNGPVDRGDAGPGTTSLLTASPTAASGFTGGTLARQRGAVGPSFGWPIIPIHVSLLPDGRVMSFGTDELGRQSGLMHYALWNPLQGTAASSHTLLTHTTGTDLFCAGHTLLPQTGEMLMAGGDRTVNGLRNFGTGDVNLFNPSGNRFQPAAKMRSARWYPTLVMTAQGEVATLGGYVDAPPSETAPPVVSDTAEVFSHGSWRSLYGAVSREAYGLGNWYYPRAWWSPNGRGLFIAAHHGGMYWMNPAGRGSIMRATGQLAASADYLPSIMFERGRILSVRHTGVVEIDINGSQPRITPRPALPAPRLTASAAVLADGSVALTGGSAVWNQTAGVQNEVLLWHPDRPQQWVTGAPLTRPRLYHSTSLLLPDATLLVAGGGAPGPVTNLNAEIYYPPYLFENNTSGRLARRPVVQHFPREASWNQVQIMDLEPGFRVSRVTMVRLGNPTHGWDADARFLRLTTTVQSGNQIRVTMPPSPNVAPPGYYLVFAFNTAGVPAMGRIVKLL